MQLSASLNTSTKLTWQKPSIQVISIAESTLNAPGGGDDGISTS
jgi:hypothetical protein